MNATTNPTSRRTAQRAFTLIEILVVVVILAVLIGLLLPAVSKMHRSAQIVTTKQSFQTIATGLANYKADFRDYPRNGFATTDSWNSYYTSTPSSNATLIVPPRTDGTLAMALIGPGPAAAMAAGVSTRYAIDAAVTPKCDMDGQDGPGFKSRLAQVDLPSGMTPMLANPAKPGDMTITVNVPLPQYQAPTVGGTALPFNFTTISLGGPGSADSHVPITKWNGTTITLAVPLQGNITPGPNAMTPPTYAPYPGDTTPVGLLLPSGQTWGPYIPVDKFKILYFEGSISSYNGSGTTPPSLYSPLLSDSWGNPILYFPAYSPYTNPVSIIQNVNQYVASTNSWTPPVAIPPKTTMAIGPLLGAPSNIPYAYQFNTPVDANKHTAPSIFWIGPLGSYGGSAAASASASSNVPFTNGQLQALLFKLGDVNGYNAIPVGATFPVSEPYFLMSAGPDGQYTDLYPGQNAPPAAPATLQTAWKTIMQKSGNIYSFDQ